jgi:hypothetical protein
MGIKTGIRERGSGILRAMMCEPKRGRIVLAVLAVCAAVSGCARTGQSSAADFAPMPPTHLAYQASPEAIAPMLDQPENGVADVGPMALNDLQSAAGDMVDAQSVAALHGCSLDGKFRPEDKTGYRWGEGEQNRLGLAFSPSTGTDEAQGRTVMVGYRYTFRTSRDGRRGGC